MKQNEIMEFVFSKEIYSKEALIKSAYGFTDRAYVHIDVSQDNYLVKLVAKNGCSINLREFENEMLAQMARIIVAERTKDIRRLTIARALASTIVSDKDTSEVQDSPDYSIDDVVKDWFDNE